MLLIFYKKYTYKKKVILGVNNIVKLAITIKFIFNNAKDENYYRKGKSWQLL